MCGGANPVGHDVNAITMSGWLVVTEIDAVIEVHQESVSVPDTSSVVGLYVVLCITHTFPIISVLVPTLVRKTLSNGRGEHTSIRNKAYSVNVNKVIRSEERS